MLLDLQKLRAIGPQAMAVLRASLTDRGLALCNEQTR
jgi:hypothetical protein